MFFGLIFVGDGGKKGGGLLRLGSTPIDWICRWRDGSEEEVVLRVSDGEGLSDQ